MIKVLKSATQVAQPFNLVLFYFFFIYLFKDVKMEFRSGLPVISVPLPSRHELCNFTLRPVSSTVGDFLASLKLEDKGIDRAHIYATGKFF